MNVSEAKTLKKLSGEEEQQQKKVIVLNISQFELTKILYSSGILAQCDLTPSAKLFLWALCSHYNPNNKTMFPSQQTVAAKLGISEKSAQRAVKELKMHGLIDYETKRVNHYVFGEKFFELVKMSGMVGQNVLREGGQNVRLTNKKEKKKEHGFSLNLQNKRTPDSEETRKFIDEKNKIGAMGFNPYDCDRKSALEWLRSTPKFWLLKSKAARFLIEKYKFSEFQQVFSKSEDNADSDLNSDLN